MSLHKLEFDKLVIEVDAKGAELRSIVNKETGLEYLWEANPLFWAKKSPILFPIVGGLKDDAYYYDENIYKLSRHGFARDKVFTVKNIASNSISFSIESNEDTFIVYPFHFELIITYTIEDSKLTVSYSVANKAIDGQIMYYSIGAHPAFKVPLTEGTEYNDWYLHFNQVENSDSWPLTSTSLISNSSISSLNETQTLQLQKELFYNDALVYKNLKSTSITLKSDKSLHGLIVSYENFPFMGIWAAKNADFVCIEPWKGIADSVDTNQQLIDKEGIISIESQQIQTSSWNVIFN